MTDPAAKPESPGVACPQCGCRHLPALYTRRVGKRTIRVRQCRHCGKKVRTCEKLHAPGD